MYYRICDNCGAVLDVGEKCDCIISGTSDNEAAAKTINRSQGRAIFRSTKKEGINKYVNTQIQS